MKLTRVEIDNFYSYRSYVIKVPDSLFNVWGLNGQGKTSLQMAIRLGLGWSPATHAGESLENVIHEDEEQSRITLIFNNSDNVLKGYPDKVMIERYFIRGDGKPRMKMTNQNGKLVIKSQSEIRAQFSKLGYDPDDSGIFIEQGDLRTFFTISSSALLEKCIGLAGLRDTNENLKRGERAFNKIEDVSRDIQRTISVMEEELERYRPGHDACLKFREFDEDLKRIELENKAIQYHKKRIEAQTAQIDMCEKKESLEKYRKEWQHSKKIVNDAQDRLKELKRQLKNTEEQNKNILEIIDTIANERNQNKNKKIELEELILRLTDPNIPSSEHAKMQLDKIQNDLTFLYSKHGKKQEALQIVESQLADMESGLVSGIVPSKQKVLKQQLVNAGIKTEFLVDCLEIKKGSEDYQDKLEILLDPFKFHLVIEKRYLQKAIGVLKGETEVGIIVPDDWMQNDEFIQSAQNHLIIKEGAPQKLRDFLTYFALNRENGYGPKDRAFLEPSIRFHRIHLSINPMNINPGIGEEGQRIARYLAEKQKNSLKSNINDLSSEINQLKQQFKNTKEMFEMAEKKPYVDDYKNCLKIIRKDIDELNEKQNDILSNHSSIGKIIGELGLKINQNNQLITENNLYIAEKRVVNYENHCHDAKIKYDDLKRDAELFQKDCETEYIEKFNEITEAGLTNEFRSNNNQTKEINKAKDELEIKFTLEHAKADFNLFKNQNFLIQEKRKSFKKQQEHSIQLKEEWDKARQIYKNMASQLFDRTNLIFRNLYKKQDENADGQIRIDFNAMLPELDVLINIGTRKKLISLNKKVGGASGGERLAAVVNLIVSILKARSQLAKIKPDLYRPQPFLFIDEPQQDMDDPAFRNAILNFKEVMDDTQIIILTHKALPYTELWQLWLYRDPEFGTIGLSHRGDFNKLVDKNAE